MSGADMDYNFGQKRHWRRWVWNRIAERVPDRRSALVVYLAGTEDFDRQPALDRGFAAHNLIAVERNREALYSIRKRGVLTIGGDFFDATDALACKGKVGVVFADLCCGLDRKLFRRIISWLSMPTMRECVFVVNLLRGRDQNSNAIRDAYATGASDVFAKVGVSEKHRGVHLLLVVHQIYVHSYIKSVIGADLYDQHVDYLKSRMETDPDAEFDYYPAEWVEAETKALKALGLWGDEASFSSYRSNANQTFDTVVFRHPLRKHNWNIPDGLWTSLKSGMSSAPEKRSTFKSAHAVMAHRTMRMN